MKRAITVSIFPLFLTGLCALLFMTNFEDYLRIKMHENRYFEWVEQEHPYLKELKNLDTFHRRVDNYSRGAHVFPYVFYSAQYGDSDGIVQFTYILEVDEEFLPSDVYEGRISVTLLPARKQAQTKSGRTRNIYWGRYLDLSHGWSITKRIISGDSFSDLEREIEERPDLPMMRFADTDPWNHLIERNSNQLVESTETSSATH